MDLIEQLQFRPVSKIHSLNYIPAAYQFIRVLVYFDIQNYAVFIKIVYAN